MIEPERLNKAAGLVDYHFAVGDEAHTAEDVLKATMAGASCMITNPEKLTPILKATDLLLGRDEYAARYIKTYRKRVALGLAAEATPGKS